MDQGGLDDPFFFLLPSTAIVGPGDPIKIPSDDHAMVDWEGELAVVIGQSARMSRSIAPPHTSPDTPSATMSLPVASTDELHIPPLRSSGTG